jgi:hypothetical protein
MTRLTPTAYLHTTQVDLELCKSIITTCIETGRLQPTPNYINLLLWKNLNHFDEWAKIKNVNSASVRIAELPSSFLPMVAIPTGCQRHDVAIVGIAFGEAADYSDTILQIHFCF